MGKYYSVISHTSVTPTNRSKSKYQGGFVIVNNRTNNSKAYNKDYYQKNKSKWLVTSLFDKAKELFSYTQDQLRQVINDGKELVKQIYETVESTISDQIIDKGKEVVDQIANTVSDVTENVANKVEEITTPKPKTYEFDMGDPQKDMEERSRKMEESYNQEQVSTGLKEYYEKYSDALNHQNGLHEYKYKVDTSHGERYFYSDAEFYSFMDRVPRKKYNCTVQEDMSMINPDYNLNDSKTYKNCGFCTFAYDLRRRGYDVSALHTNMGTYDTTCSSLYETKDGQKVEPERFKLDNSKYDKTYTEQLFDKLSEYGDGASGELCVDWDTGGGHSMAWQNINGKTYVLDCQSNTMYDAKDFRKQFENDMYWNSYKAPTYTRLDDKVIKQNGGAFIGGRTKSDGSEYHVSYIQDYDDNDTSNKIRAYSSNISSKSYVPDQVKSPIISKEKIVETTTTERQSARRGRVTTITAPIYIDGYYHGRTITKAEARGRRS